MSEDEIQESGTYFKPVFLSNTHSEQIFTFNYNTLIVALLAQYEKLFRI